MLIDSLGQQTDPVSDCTQVFFYPLFSRSRTLPFFRSLSVRLLSVRHLSAPLQCRLGAGISQVCTKRGISCVFWWGDERIHESEHFGRILHFAVPFGVSFTSTDFSFFAFLRCLNLLCYCGALCTQVMRWVRKKVKRSSNLHHHAQTSGVVGA